MFSTGLSRMALLVGCVLLSPPSHSRTACLDGATAPLPMRATFDGGAAVEVLERSAAGLRYRTVDPRWNEPLEVLSQAGIFNMEFKRGEEIVVFDWTTTLPVMADLVVGASFEASAQKTGPGDAVAEFVTKALVTGEEVITLDGCSYPVLVIEVENLENGLNVGRVTKFLHVTSQIVLRNTIKVGDKITVNNVVALE